MRDCSLDPRRNSDLLLGAAGVHGDLGAGAFCRGGCELAGQGCRLVALIFPRQYILCFKIWRGLYFLANATASLPLIKAISAMKESRKRGKDTRMAPIKTLHALESALQGWGLSLSDFHHGNTQEVRPLNSRWLLTMTDKEGSQTFGVTVLSVYFAFGRWAR